MLLAGLIALAIGVVWLASGAARAADPGKAGPGAGSVKLENVPGSPAPRVILSAKAAQRLGIETGKVAEEAVARKLMVSGVIIPPLKELPTSVAASGAFGGFGGFGQAEPAPKKAAKIPPSPPGSVWVQMALSPGEWDRLAKDKPARILPLLTREKLGKEALARPTGIEPFEDMKRSTLSLYYLVSGKDHGLAVNSRTRVELQVAGSDEKQKVVPYGSVYYDAKGAPWVYVNGTPLTYQRERIGVERIVGDLAVLSEGPAVGTPIVTVGAAMLYGAEIFKK
jgi:hypothetical protein